MKQLYTPNFTKGRSNFKPEAIVIHITDGNLKGDIEWLCSEKSKVSYHYLIGTDMQIYKLVDPMDTAWHAGKVLNPNWQLIKKDTNPNLYTIGIALTGFPQCRSPFDQQIVLIRLIAELAKVYRIPLDENHVIGHNRIRSDKVCPGPWIVPEAILKMALVA